MARKLLLPAVLSAILAMMLPAQEQAVVDRLLEAKAASFDDLAYCTLVAGGQLPESATPEEAGTWVRAQSWGFASAKADGQLSLAEFCHLIIQSLKIPGGFMYSIFPGPRYAFQALKAYDCLFAGSTPDQTLAGDAALSILAEALAWKEAHP